MEMTLLSSKEFENISAASMSPDEAYEYLSREVCLRSFAQVIKDYAPNENLSALLSKRLAQYNPDKKADSIAKKVRDWLSGKYEPADRETYFQLCFALNLNEERAVDFMHIATESGIHYRNPRELTYAFALRTGMDYPEAKELFFQLPKPEITQGSPSVYTETIMREFKNITLLEEFKRFYSENLSKLGELHNKAYSKFMVFINCIANPDSEMKDIIDDESMDAALSVEEIVQEYMRMDVPADTKTAAYTSVQKIVKRYWPNATTIKNMRAGTVDVNRKILILLYLITEGITPDDEDIYFDESDLTDEEIFREHFDKINVMLLECGFSPLDPRNVFDWLVLYSIKPKGDEPMSEILREMLNRIFSMPQQ